MKLFRCILFDDRSG